MVDAVERDQRFIESSMEPVTTPDGKIVRVARFGSGDPVVCVPTVPELNFVYAPQIRALSAYREVLIYEPYLSRQRNVSVPERAEELRSVISLFDGVPVDVVAWSDAGSVAYFATHNTERTMGSVAYLGLPDRYRFPPLVHAVAKLFYRYPLHRAIPSLLVRLLLCYFLGGHVISWRLLFIRGRGIRQLSALFKYSILPCMLEHEVFSYDSSTRATMLVGEKDRVVSVVQADRMAKAINDDCDLIVVPSGEHILNYANAGAVNSELVRFFR